MDFTIPEQVPGFYRALMRRWYFAPGAVIYLALSACAPSGTQNMSSDIDLPAPSSLEMVDCLLPGQVRKLGSNLTYLSPRRPARTTETECEIRGGEYVAYDRANYQTALAVWLDSANQGDAKAQNYVGEIYAKGMGTVPDYEKAAHWYQKAAEQGYEQAKINLGYLYEQGLGVERDLVSALNLYREATGVSGDSLQFSSEIERIKVSNRELQQLKQQVAQQSVQVNTLTDQLESARGELVNLERSMKANQATVAAAADSVISAETKALIRDKREEIERLKQILASRNTEYQQVRDSLMEAQEDLDQARERIYSAYQENRSLREQLEVTLRRLQDKESRLEELSALKKEVESRLQASRSGEDVEQVALLKIQLQQSQEEIDRLQEEKRRLESESDDLYARIEPQLASAGSALTYRSAGLDDNAANAVRSVKKVEKKLGDFYALIIGNDDYLSVDPLSTAVNDARSVEGLLKEKYGFKTNLLINATKSELITALWKLKKEMSDVDNLLVYYAGHGEVNKSRSKGYWLMTDAREADPTTWISNNTLTEFISSLPVKRVMVIADSCYSGTLSSTALAGRPLDELYQPDRAAQLADAGAQLVLTSGGISPVLDNSGGEHSVFAQALIESLQRRGGTLNGYDLFLDVKAKVLSRAAVLGVEQEPTYSPLAFAHKGGEFYFQSIN